MGLYYKRRVRDIPRINPKSSMCQEGLRPLKILKKAIPKRMLNLYLKQEKQKKG